jgi:hypothetical protein
MGSCVRHHYKGYGYPEDIADQGFAPGGCREGGVGMLDVEFRKTFYADNINFVIDALGLGNNLHRRINLFSQWRIDASHTLLRVASGKVVTLSPAMHASGLKAI